MCTNRLEHCGQRLLIHICISLYKATPVRTFSTENSKDEIVENVLLKMGQYVSRNYNNTDSVIIANIV